MAGAFGRTAFALMGAALGAAAVAFWEACAVVMASRGLSLVDVALGEVGVLAPLAGFIGAVVVVASLYLEPRGSPTPVARMAALRSQPVVVRANAAALGLLWSCATTGWLVLTAHAGRIRLAEGAPLAAGGALAVTSIACLAAVAAVCFALLPVVRGAFVRGGLRWPVTTDPGAILGFAVAIFSATIAIGIFEGDTGGEGWGPLAIFGVLKRDELDLRPLFEAGAMAACAWAAALLWRTRPWRAWHVAIALCGGMLPLSATVREADALERDPTVARAIERQAPLGRVALALVRRATDRDHDGASPYFGGGDCDDRNPAISPLAVDIPGNGIDEDCSGSDLPAPVIVEPPARAARSPMIDRDYNLIFVTIDTVRAGELGFMGYPRPTSPNLDALAAKSTVFDRAYAMASYTGKALAPMLIGKYPSETLRDGGHFNTYAAGNVFLSERLQSASVLTMGAASHWYFRERWGVTQGFDFFDRSAMPVSGQGDTDSTTTGAQLTDASIKLLQAHASGRRFMLWVHYFDPHAQYVPHEGAPDFADPAKPPGWKMRAAYDGEIWFTDAQIGRLLDYARAQPWWKDTVVVVTSDHGESLGEHGIRFQHGWEIWEPLVRIPLLFYVPGMPPHRVAEKRSAIDIVPTVLDLMRVPRPGRGELSGESLLPDLAAKATDPIEERDVYLDMPDGPYTHMRRGLIHGATPGMKLIHLGGRQYQLYDLAADPEEREDISGNPAKLQAMIEALSVKRAGLHEITVKADAPAGP